MAGKVDFTLVILSCNRKDDLRESLSIIYGYWGDKEIEVIVTDNNSIDGTQNMVVKEFPQVNLIINKDNIGVAACNKAFKEASCYYSLEQRVLIYFKAIFFAFIHSSKAFSRRKKVKKILQNFLELLFTCLLPCTNEH